MHCTILTVSALWVEMGGITVALLKIVILYKVALNQTLRRQ
jgi:hypothetical protein